MKKSLALIMATLIALFTVVTLSVTAFADPADATTTESTEDLGEDPTRETTTTTTTTKPTTATTTAKPTTTSTTKATEKPADQNASTIGDTEWADQTTGSTTKAAPVDSNFPATGTNGSSIAVFVALAISAGVAAVVATKKKED